MPIAVAAPNELAADAGAQLAEAGGNAVDAAIAAAVVAMVTEPGICALAGGAYVTIRPPDGPAETVDANVEMPGRGLPEERFGQGTFDITAAYGGGIDITIGHGSVAVPGTPAGLGLAHERHGGAPWREVLAPAVSTTRAGFPMGDASTYYLEYVHEDLFGWHGPSHRAIHDDAGALIPTGGTVVIDHLADTLAQLGEEGPAAFYTGSIGSRIVADVQENDGLVTAEDLARYRPVVRSSLETRAKDWIVATNPPPAIGGVTLTAMLRLLEGLPAGRSWTDEELRRLVAVQDVVLSHRVEVLDRADDRERAASDLLAAIDRGRFDVGRRSASTINISAVDGDGLACTVTASAGYGSGVMPPATGLWLNNCLGEQELNRRGLHAWRPGERLPSNMAPTVAARHDGSVLSIGSPGADRITTAILQTLLPHLNAGIPLEEAVAAPRVHVRHDADGHVLEVGHEEDLDLPELDLPVRSHHPLAMFFGGVTAARRGADGSLEAAADPRRGGATRVTRK